MRPIRTAPPKNEREYPLTITAEEKDKVVNAILVAANGKATAELHYRDIPDIGISKDQYEMVIEEFKKKGLVSYYGYGNENLKINSEISNFYQKGGFTVERDLYTINFDVLELQLKRLDKELSPDTAAKVNNIIGKAKNITELISGLANVVDKMNL